jgi:predicted ABC-type ATPase
MASATDPLPPDRRPLIVAVAGPNGAGKTTFYRLHLQQLGLRYVNADDLARELEIEAYEAANLAAETRAAFVRERQSFVFETVFSDPAGDKVRFLADAIAQGYAVVLCFIGLESVALSEARVVHRVLCGGHDVPTEKLEARFPRTLENLGRAARELPLVLLYDNGDRDHPFRPVARFESGALVERHPPDPGWARGLLKSRGRRRSR